MVENLHVPATSKEGDKVPTITAELHNVELNSNDDFPLNWSSDDEECVELSLPSLSFVLASATGLISVQGLADSGATSSFISDEKARALGLVRQK